MGSGRDKDRDRRDEDQDIQGIERQRPGQERQRPGHTGIESDKDTDRIGKDQEGHIL